METHALEGPDSSGQPTAAPEFSALPGQFAIHTAFGHRLTAVDGGGRVTDAIRTDAGAYSQLGPFDRFTLWSDPIRYHPGPEHRYAIQTADGHYLTASGGGHSSASDAIHTDATQIRRWEEFGVVANQWWDVALVVASGNYLTAVGGGGKTSNALHTDATVALAWEQFRLAKLGDLGSGLSYFIVPINYGTAMAAVDGGGHTKDALHIMGFAPPVPLSAAVWTLLRQPNGSYALRTRDGNYLTADRGGGLANGNAQGDVLQTNRTVAQAWEQFMLTEQDNAQYVMQTVSGDYLGYRSSGTGGLFVTNAPDPEHAEHFILLMAGW